MPIRNRSAKTPLQKLLTRNHILALLFALAGIVVLFIAATNPSRLFSFAKGAKSGSIPPVCTQVCRNLIFYDPVTESMMSDQAPTAQYQSSYQKKQELASCETKCAANPESIANQGPVGAGGPNVGLRLNCPRDYPKGTKPESENPQRCPSQCPWELGYSYWSVGGGRLICVRPKRPTPKPSPVPTAPKIGGTTTTGKSKATVCTPICGTYFGVKYCRTVCK